MTTPGRPPRTGRRRPSTTTESTPPFPRDDPREEVGNFDRAPPEERRRPPRPLKGQAPVLPGDGTYRPCSLDKARCEFWAERAAIRQYLGGEERWIAERLAEEDLLSAYERGEIP